MKLLTHIISGSIVIASLLLWVAPARADTGAHIVQPGETLFQIALTHGVSVEALRATNGIYLRYPSQRMIGPGYDLPGVPYMQYFYKDYGLHGTDWHTNFGQPMSHGCVNLPTPEAEWAYTWADFGTPVIV